MRSPNSGSKKWNGILDTLAQTRTALYQDSSARPFIIVHGEGSDLLNHKALAGRAKRKTITQKMILSLVDVARRKKKEERIKSYWNTYHCQNQLFSFNGKFYGNYCKNRICTLCCSIRKATIINQYLPVIETWEDCHFVTLTIKSIPAKELPRYFKGMLNEFRKIIEKYRKRGKRNGGIILQGLKSLECNFNPQMRTYNPHLHIIVRSKEMGEALIQEWLSRIPRKHANSRAQMIRKVDDKQRDLIEIVKYGTKIFTEPDLKKKGKERASPYVYVSALDNIISAMEKHRIFDRFGFNLPPELKKRCSNKSKVLACFDEWLYNPKNMDWINEVTGEVLSGYTLSRELMSILKDHLNTELQ